MKILQIIKDIESATGKKKQAIIEEHKDSALLKDVVRYTHDTLMSFHLSKTVPVVKNVSIFDIQDTVTKKHELSDVFDYLDYLNNKGSANRQDQNNLDLLVGSMDKDDQEVVNLILGRSLKCGASLATFRKVYGLDFLPDFPCMLCESYSEEKVMKNITFPAYSQLKSDGARCMSVVKFDGSVSFHSRNGKPFHGLDYIAEELSDSLCAVFDGELVVVDVNGEILPRQTGNGIINKASNGTISPEESKRVRYIVWDVITDDEFYGHSVPEMIYECRFNALERMTKEMERVQLTESRVVNSLAEAKTHYFELLQKGEEGTILKNMKLLFNPKRSNEAIKFKEEHPVDLEIVDWYKGKPKTKFADAVGGFTVRSSCGMIESNVGSGLTDALRFVDNPDDYIGKIVEIKYNQRSITEGSETESDRKSVV